MLKRILKNLCLHLCLCLSLLGCGGYPRIVSYPFGETSSSLNSVFSELTPQITERYLVFSSDRRQHQDIYLYDQQSKELLDLPGLNALDMITGEPMISADGSYIAFSGFRAGQSDIYLYNRDTHQLRNLTKSLKAQVRHPSISANGSMIAFEANVAGQWDILIYNRYGQPLNFDPVYSEGD